ncbi:MAG: DUF2066 domain-containing protein [Hyphomicrobiaceae bacterium]|nr:DUF2066 domain-containing protein [Hyphomicrobiaceae bacterium]
MRNLMPAAAHNLGLSRWALVAALSMAAAPLADARGADAVYTVGNYPVQAAAKNAVAAKDQAIADGQQAAFRSLLKRLVPVTAYGRLKALKTTDAKALIDGYAVRSERNSTTEYIASLDFTFRAGAVRNLLARENVPFVEEQAPEVILIAAVRDGDKLLRDGEVAKAWIDIWRDLDLVNALTPLRLEPIKPVIHNDTLNMLVAGDDSAIRVLASEYTGENIVAAIIEIDQPASRVHVTLAGRDAVGVFNLKRSYRLYDGDLGYSMEMAAVISMGIVEGRWKSVKDRGAGGYAAGPVTYGGGAIETYGGGAASSAPAPGSEPVRMQVEFKGLSEWNAVRSRVLETPGVSGVQIDAVSARGADMQLAFPGGGEALATAFAARGLRLTNVGGNWFLRSGY